jgi:hypothetical protein
LRGAAKEPPNDDLPQKIPAAASDAVKLVAATPSAAIAT